LKEAENLIVGKACVYATGSFGRLEAGERSDLDLFIVVDTQKPRGPKAGRVGALDGLDEIKLKYHLIKAVENGNIARFDGGGKYLAVHTVGDFTGNLGSPEDDAKNTFTGRLLMLLESKPLLESGIYAKAVGNVTEAYFIDYHDNKASFIPAFLINDIMRMWRTFCVNYEYYRTKGSVKSKVKLLKLKYSRMLTCYSAIVFLLALFVRNGSVRPSDVGQMVRLTPTQRLEAIGGSAFWAPSPPPPSLPSLAREALQLYSEFLELVHRTDVSEQYVRHEKEWRSKSLQFRDKLANLIDVIAHSAGEPSRLYRFILI
jgi:hypothetical protein